MHDWSRPSTFGDGMYRDQRSGGPRGLEAYEAELRYAKEYAKQSAQPITARHERLHNIFLVSGTITMAPFDVCCHLRLRSLDRSEG
jgi:hypothetical protein